MKSKFSKRQKLIFTATNPSVEGFTEDGINTSLQEIKRLDQKCRGSYFNMKPVLGEEEYFACSPSGKKKFFDYNFAFPSDHKRFMIWKNTAKQAAKLWSLGKCKEAVALDKYNWNINYYGTW